MQKKKEKSKEYEIRLSDACLGTKESMQEKDRPESDRCYTYMVRCADNSLYTGWTVDLEKRVAAHNSGQGAKYTKSRRPVVLVYYEVFENRQDAMRREYAIKQLTKKEKESLAACHSLSSMDTSSFQSTTICPR